MQSQSGDESQRRGTRKPHRRTSAGNQREQLRSRNVRPESPRGRLENDTRAVSSDGQPANGSVSASRGTARRTFVSREDTRQSLHSHPEGASQRTNRETSRRASSPSSSRSRRQSTQRAKTSTSYSMATLEYRPTVPKRNQKRLPTRSYVLLIIIALLLVGLAVWGVTSCVSPLFASKEKADPISTDTSAEINDVKETTLVGSHSSTQPNDATVAFANETHSSFSNATESENVYTAVSTEGVQATSAITVSFCGDCTLGTDETFDYNSSLNAMYEETGPSYFFSNVRSIFESDDVSVANMEGTLTTSTTREDKTFAFKGPASFAQILVEGDIEVAAMANNHSYDYGEQSYTDTQEALESAGIKTYGYSRVTYWDAGGVKVAFIALNDLSYGEELKSQLETMIAEERTKADIVTVYIHWGNETEAAPTETQTMLGHAAIDAGADCVIGSHPHVLQGIEEYKGKFIAYSMGNFCFGGNSNPSDKDTMILQFTFGITNTGLVRTQMKIVPCSISSVSYTNDYCPTPSEGDEYSRIMNKIITRSDMV